MERVRLTRAAIRGRATVPGLDITIKTAQGWARAFCPTWEMVLGHKNGTAQREGRPLEYPRHPPLTDKEYTARYHQILERIPDETWRQFWRYAQEQGGAVTFLCYCSSGAFCHTHLIIQWLYQRWPHRFEDARDLDSMPPRSSRELIDACHARPDGGSAR